MESGMNNRAKRLVFALACACVLAGCASYGPGGDTAQYGNYYDPNNPASASYQGQGGYYDYPYQPGTYGYPYYPGLFGPALYFGAGRFGGSSGVGIGTTFGF